MTTSMTEQRALRLRPVSDDDDAFLAELIRDLKAVELESSGMSGPELDELVDLQRQDEDRKHDDAHPKLERLVVVVEGESVGRLVLAETPTALHVVDIAILEAHRGRGIGTRLMLDVQACAAEVRLPVTLEVVKSNPALRLFERLGFTIVGDGLLHQTLSWTPVPVTADES